MQNHSLAKDLLSVCLLAVLSLLVHGYHLGIEDEAIYLPAVKKLLSPSLYPHDANFFLAQTKFTLFDEMIAFLARVTSLPVDFLLFFIHFISIFLVLFACLQLSRLCFRERYAHWASVSLIAALLTIPVTGTALYIMDQHLHPRSLSTAAILFAIVYALKSNYPLAALSFLVAALLHAQMAFYGFIFSLFLIVNPPSRQDSSQPVRALALTPSAAPQLSSEMWDRIRTTRIHHYPLQWHWYEWLGIVAPLALLFWYGSFRSFEGSSIFRHISRRMAAFGAMNVILAVTLTIPDQFHKISNLQPMRSFHLVYLVFFLLTGGIIGRWILKNKPLRWVLLFLPLCLGMFTAQRFEFPASRHIELPGHASENQWLQAFDWIRHNTPQDAYFALDPYYMKRPGEDYHGFRALAERSMMADYVKDVAVAALSVTARTIGADREVKPVGVSEIWCDHMTALDGWKDFKTEDFRRLKERFGVSWVILEKPGVEVDMTCPYENSLLKVCRID